MLIGLGLLFVVLVIFSLFSMKSPFGQKAMSGLADAAVASFLVEAIHMFILGDALGIPFFMKSAIFPAASVVLQPSHLFP